eukprot:TRINITY_DN610_c0_g1_i1.p1 TRINITY_DN610_c0_g1~~TRINITY_DN610_c0_g1_i1.p1  ORF type:complete len:491 (-),score=109.61 TRINITY_DN610_c0_g1_i1:53-1525(-)
MALTFARGMEKLGLPAEQMYEGRKLRAIGIHSKNRLEWVLTDMACWMTSVTSIPFYESLGDSGINYIIEQTEITTLFMSIEGLHRAIELKKKGQIRNIKNLVCFDDIPTDYYDKSDLNLILFRNIMEVGRKETEVELRDSEPEDIMTICYTSGTSGVPKGALILHGRFRDATASFVQYVIKGRLGPDTALISYLPLAHIYERTMVNLVIISGFREGFFHGVISELKDDIMECKPVFFSGVPRILCRFYESMMKSINSLTGFKRNLAKAAVKAKMAYYKSTGEVSHPLYDKLVFNKFREAYGGRIKVFFTGSAPLDGVITDHLKIFLSAFSIHGYGQTETTAPYTLSSYYDPDSFSVGVPVPRYKIKLVDVPEMGYFSTDTVNGVSIPRGEICAKGPVIPGYFKDPERTAELFDSEGWLHSGDIGLIMPNGCLKIIDRKKHIFKLQQAVYVAPEKIENILNNSPWVHQMFVYGNSYQSYICLLYTSPSPRD